mgnify:CR=1 FL=1
MTNLNLYKFFCAVAEEKNISKASEKLYVSQPAVSFSIKELENELGQQLFIRKSKGVELTTFGKILYNQVKDLVDKFDEAQALASRFSKLEEGVIRIGACTSNVNQVVLEYLSAFAKKYPKIQIIMERGSKENLIERLKSNNLDMIFIDKTDGINNFKTIKQFNVVYQLIGDKTFKDKYSSQDIDIENFPVQDLMLPSVNNNSRITIDNFFEKHQIKLSPKYELDNYILLYEFVKKGFGIAFVNIEYYKKMVEEKEVYVIYPNFSICAREVVCLINDEITNPALTKLVDIIKKQI